MNLNEADTRAKLITPAIHKRGWPEDLIRREETAGTVEIVSGKARRRSRGKIDYVLRVKVNVDTQPVALALIEAKREGLPAGHGLDQAKGYAECKRLNVRFVFSSNGHQFVEFDCFSGLTSSPKPLTDFPTPADLRARYEKGMGFTLESPAALIDIRSDSALLIASIVDPDGASRLVSDLTGLPRSAKCPFRTPPGSPVEAARPTAPQPNPRLRTSTGTLAGPAAQVPPPLPCLQACFGLHYADANCLASLRARPERALVIHRIPCPSSPSPISSSPRIVLQRPMIPVPIAFS